MPPWEAFMGNDQQPGDEIIVRFTRKPAKSGVNYLIWIPRALVRDGLVDPNAEYEIYLQRSRRKRASRHKR